MPRKHTTISPRKKILLGFTFLAGLFVLVLILAPGSLTSQAVSNIQPALIEMAVEQPHTVVRVIVEKANADVNIEEIIPRLGGIVIQTLPATNSIVAEMSAEMAVALAATDGVSWINLDAAMTKS